MKELPFIDEHALVVEAPPGMTWQALIEVLTRASARDRVSGPFARVLGVADPRAEGSLEERGSTLIGFRVTRSEQPRELVLEGRHRFSRYALIFRIDDMSQGRSRLRAETRAAFPGLSGRAYRALVIGSGAHVAAVRRMLAAAKRRSELPSGV
jgi:hypothetical protein